MALLARQTPFRFVRLLVPCAIALALLAGSSPALTLLTGSPATFTFTAIDVPGADYTEAHGINRQGQIVGFYSTPEGSGAEGFLLDQGVFTTINFPEAIDTLLTDITGSGKILGSYTKDLSNGIPLARRPFPWLWPLLPQAGVTAHGFLLHRGVFTPFDVPGSSETAPTDISRHGQIVGWSVDTGGFRHGFLLSGGVFTTIDVPGAVDTFPNSINGRGQIAGSYNSPKTHGFLLDQGVFTTIDVPGAEVTFLWKIKGKRIVGGYRDFNGLTHGVLATP